MRKAESKVGYVLIILEVVDVIGRDGAVGGCSDNQIFLRIDLDRVDFIAQFQHLFRLDNFLLSLLGQFKAEDTPFGIEDPA
jgi:hypothetical protein